MKSKILISLLSIICYLTIHAQAVYVDSDLGDDNNSGTAEAPVYSIKKAAEIIRSSDNDICIMKINSGIYVLENHVSVSKEKDMTGKRIVIEAGILPCDASWSPEKMPVIISIARKGEIPDDYHYVVAFLIDENHVTIRGLKFPGYAYPNTRYFPIARFNKTKKDLFVEQCLFVGDEDASHLQVGIIAHGDSVRADHCVFYNIRNSAVFWQDDGSGIKTGNGITNSIIYGATQSGIWTSWPDADFVFKNNIVSNCLNFWIKNADNPTIYTIDSCIVVNNEHYLAVANNSGVVPQEFEIIENYVIKKGKISLRPKNAVTHYDLPKDYLHVMPDSLGYDMGAGLFKNKTITSTETKSLINSDNYAKLKTLPNPFNSSAVISYYLSESGFTQLIIYDLAGKEIQTLINENQNEGEYEITWNADRLLSGTYLCKLLISGHSANPNLQYSETVKLILIK